MGERKKEIRAKKEMPPKKKPKEDVLKDQGEKGKVLNSPDVNK